MEISRAASAGAIQRSLLALESQGADKFFGEPALNLDDLMQTQRGKGVINTPRCGQVDAKVAEGLCNILLWMLSELFENLPEIGDPEKPKLVFFFDEAHLLLHRHRAGGRTKDLAATWISKRITAQESPRLISRTIVLGLLFDRRRDVCEEQVRFVEKENQLRFFRIAYFGKVLE